MDLPIIIAGAAGKATVITEGFAAYASWIVLFAPLLVAFLVTCVPAIRKNVNVAAALSCGSVLLGLAITLFVYFFPSLGERTTWEAIHAWVTVDGSPVIEFGTRIDHLAITMMIVVTGVGSAIFIYALGYMKGDPSMGRFFGKFALFVFSMLGIVISSNFFQTFIFWELVGVSSYLLIGYYWKKDSAGEAAKKAFMTNRVGDFGFLLGILMVWGAMGSVTGVYTFDFEAIKAATMVGDKAVPMALFDAFVKNEGWAMAGTTAAAIAAALVFCGAMGKSAQFPLHVWLPDAMEGPTPVSALMHAATMVAAGVYMVIRANFLFAWASWAPTLICWIGGITALVAASMAITQRDIKKVLAYSTLSQLGYMTMALGAGAYSAAMFHLTTHAFFKALLFLCAGSVIHGCHHEQDMFKMGGLKKIMPKTYKTWIIGTISLTALLPIAGWWSKDEILGATGDTPMVGGAPLLLALGVIVAGMTAFYMWRATYLTFSGEYRGDHEAHESPKVMTMPLQILAAFSLFIGFIGIPAGLLGGWQNNLISDYLGLGDFHPSFHWWLAIGSTLVAIGGWQLAKKVYGSSPAEDPLPAKLGGVWTLWDRLYYIDDFYLWLVRTVQQGIAKVAWFFERWVLIQAVINDGISQPVRIAGDRVRRVQTGLLGSYVTSFLLGAAVVALLVLLQLGGE